MNDAIPAAAPLAADAALFAGQEAEGCAHDTALQPPVDEIRRPGAWDWLTSPRQWDARHAYVSDGLVAAVDPIDRLLGDEQFDLGTCLGRRRR